MLVLGVVLASTAVAQPIMGTLASWTDQVSVTGNAMSTGTLAPPTALAVSQACIPDPTPVRRSGVGGSSFTSGNSSGTVTIARPSGAVAGDVLIAGITWFGNHTSARPTAPSGWTSVQANGDNAIGQFVYYKVVTASEPASYSWTGLADAVAGGIAAYSGVDTVVPINTNNGQVNGNGDPTAPAITTTRGNAVLVGFFGLVDQQTLGAPSGMTSVYSGQSNAAGAASMNVSTLAAEQSWPTPSSTGTRTASSNGGGRAIGQLVALQPPAYPQATVTWTPSTSTFATGQEYTRSPGGTPATLGPSVSSRVTGLLTSGTAYTAALTATYYSWVSTTSSIGFTARSCWPP